jgi:cobalamin biosynthetic protein CobC
LSCAIDAEALSDRAWLDRQSRALARRAARLEAELTQAGFVVVGRTRLFRSARRDDAAPGLAQRARHGIFGPEIPRGTKAFAFR